jgi:hypothetical protein
VQEPLHLDQKRLEKGGVFADCLRMFEDPHGHCHVAGSFLNELDEPWVTLERTPSSSSLPSAKPNAASDSGIRWCAASAFSKSSDLWQALHATQYADPAAPRRRRAHQEVATA